MFLFKIRKSVNNNATPITNSPIRYPNIYNPINDLPKSKANNINKK